MTDKLRECPFCGVRLENSPPSEIWSHPINGCLLSLRGITKEQFAEWNTRKPMDRIVEQLEEQKAKHERLVDYEAELGTFVEKMQHKKAVEVLGRAIDIVKGAQND